MCRICKTNFRVRNCRLCHLKSLHPLGVLVFLFLRRYPSLRFNQGGIAMNKKLLSYFIAVALATTLALASPTLPRGGAGGGHAGGEHGRSFVDWGHACICAGVYFGG